MGIVRRIRTQLSSVVIASICSVCNAQEPLGVEQSIKRPQDETDIPALPLITDDEQTNDQANRSLPLMEKLQRLTLPSVKFQDSTLEEALLILRNESLLRDKDEEDPDLKGVHFILKPSKRDFPARITMELENVTFASALQSLMNKAETKFLVGKFAVTISPRNNETPFLITRVYKIPSDSIQRFLMHKDAEFSLSDSLQKRGLIFPDGASVFYNEITSQLIMRNTSDNHDLLKKMWQSHDSDSSE